MTVIYSIHGPAVKPHLLKINAPADDLPKIEKIVEHKFRGFKLAFDHFGKAVKVDIL